MMGLFRTQMQFAVFLGAASFALVSGSVLGYVLAKAVGQSLGVF